MCLQSTDAQKTFCRLAAGFSPRKFALKMHQSLGSHLLHFTLRKPLQFLAKMKGKENPGRWKIKLHMKMKNITD